MRKVLQIISLISFMAAVFAAGVSMITICAAGIMKIVELKKNNEIQPVIKNVSGRVKDFVNNNYWKKEIVE